MEDKNFLDYFHELADSKIEVKKQAAYKIVETLSVHEALGKDKDYSHLDEKVLKMLQKYLQKDFGEKVSADINFTIRK
jgi:hypothetical protein